MVATNSAVYVGGGFPGAGGTLAQQPGRVRRPRTARCCRGTRTPTTRCGRSRSSDDGASVFAGGSFQNVGGQPAYGLAKIDGRHRCARRDVAAAEPSATPARTPASPACKVQGGFVYGTTYHFGPGGNLEGTFKAPVGTGDVEWVTDCHGDNYSSFMTNGVVYTAGHAHYCGNMGGGFPQYPTWKFQHARPGRDTVGRRDPQRGPRLPQLARRRSRPGDGQLAARHGASAASPASTRPAGASPATTTTSSTAASSQPSTASASRVWSASPSGRSPRRKEGPRFVGNADRADAGRRPRPTSLRVSWPAGFDRDDHTLTYKVVRDRRRQRRATTGTAELQLVDPAAAGLRRHRPDPGRDLQLPGRGQRRPTATPSTAPPLRSPCRPRSPAPTATPTSVRSNGARIYWPLNETSGTTVTDRAAGTERPHRASASPTAAPTPA